MEWLGIALGTLLGAIVVYYLVCGALGYFMPAGMGLYSLSLIGAAIVIMTVTHFNGLEFGFSFILYMPALFLWYAIDVIRWNKKREMA